MRPHLLLLLTACGGTTAAGSAPPAPTGQPVASAAGAPPTSPQPAATQAPAPPATAELPGQPPACFGSILGSCERCGEGLCKPGERCLYPEGDCDHKAGYCAPRPQGDAMACTMGIVTVCTCSGKSYRLMNGCVAPPETVRSSGPCPGGGPIQDLDSAGQALPLGGLGSGLSRDPPPKPAVEVQVGFSSPASAEDHKAAIWRRGAFRNCLAPRATPPEQRACAVEASIQQDGSASEASVSCSPQASREMNDCLEAVTRRGMAWEKRAHKVSIKIFLSQGR